MRRWIIAPLALALMGCPGPGEPEAPDVPPQTFPDVKGQASGAAPAVGFETSGETFRPANLPWAEVVARGSDGYLTLRSMPGVEAGERVAELPDGVQVRVYRCRDDVERADGADGSWCRVRLDAVQGWVFDAYIAPASGGRGTHTAAVSDFLAIRSEPSASSGRQKLRLLPGASLTLGDCRGQSTVGGTSGRWCEVSISAQEGWVFGGFLRQLQR